MQYLLIILLLIALFFLAINVFKYNALKTELSKSIDELTSTSNQLHQSKELTQAQALELACLKVEKKNIETQAFQHLDEKKQLHKALTGEFENMANRILNDRSEHISNTQNQKLSELLNPFKERIQAFEKTVLNTYEKELRDKLDLQSEVKRLYELNQRISVEAGNLTKALKGDVKKMGNWGELILERVLEQSGLTKGREFEREVSLKNNEGSTIRPDVIIHLPDEKHIIIDSKLSLIAYERYINANEEATRQLALKSHLESMRTHIKTLHEKNYTSATTLNTPDFVLMFIPVEASFAAAIEADSNLFGYAWEKQIVPVSPSTLLATLRTISAIWKQDNQNQNALEIANQSGALYDKLAGFVSDMEKIGKSIDQAQNNYSGAMNKLSHGKGNLLSKAEKIRLLGAKNSKQIPPHLSNSLDL